MAEAVKKADLKRLHRAGISKSVDHVFVYRFPESDDMPLFDAEELAQDLLQNKRARELALYLHIPYCTRICYYCHYFKQMPGTEKQVAEFVQAVQMEASAYRNILDKVLVNSLLFGGGTPTSLEAMQVNELALFIKKAFRVKRGTEATVESSPETLSLEKLSALRQNFNRLSIGVQDFNDSVLKACNRNHGMAQAFKAIKDAGDAGFEAINIDLIYGLPGQGIKGWLKTLNEVDAIQPESVTASDLRVHRGTAFFARPREQFASEAELIEMHSAFIEKMLSLGYGQLFPYQFVKRGQEMRFLQNQWQSGEFLGLGPSSCSFLNEWDYNNVFPTAEYVKQVEEAGIGCAVGKKLSKEESMKRFAALGLKDSRKGIDKREFRKRFSLAFDERFGPVARMLEDLELVESSETCLKLSQKGTLFYDSVSRKFLEN